MKRTVLFSLAILGLFAAASCKDIIPEEGDGKSILDIVKDDYNAIVAKYPAAKDHLVEARFTLDNNIADVPATDLNLETLMTICYVFNDQKGYSDIFVNEHNFKTGESELSNYTADSPWLGDKMINEETLKKLSVTLEDALDKAKKEAGSGDGLNTRFVTLRWPLWPVWDNPQYVVGGSASRSDHVFVDSVTGKVSIEEGYVPEGSSQYFYIYDLSEIADTYDGKQRLGFQLDVKWSLVEVQYELSSAVNASKVSDLEPEKATYIYYVAADDNHPAYNIRAKRNSFKVDTDLEFFDEVATTPWTGGDYIDFTQDYLGVEDVIPVVKFGNVTDTDTNLITLCVPKGSDAPVYIFKGNKVPSVTVDALTGEILQ